MSVTATPETGLNTNYALASLQARGIGIEFGTIAFDSSYAGNGGESVSFKLKDVVLCLIAMRSGYVFEYVHATGKVIARYKDATTGSNALKEVVTGASLAALSDVPYVAFGYEV